ncbi:MAG: hypothetical protein OSA98_07585 [Rubripirellula sp.]|nr:hypothetical protein [Rubripirellula sp.]
MKLRFLIGLVTQLYNPTTTNERLGFGHPETPIKLVLQPWQLMLIILTGWVSRQQQEVI